MMKCIAYMLSQGGMSQHAATGLAQPGWLSKGISMRLTLPALMSTASTLALSPPLSSWMEVPSTLQATHTDTH
jgi:hypothetical protein